MHFHLKLLLFTFLIVLTALGGCSLYQSEGRKCIEEGCASFIPKSVSFLESVSLHCQNQGNDFFEQSQFLYEAKDQTPSGLQIFLDLNSESPAIIVAEDPHIFSQTSNYCRFEHKDQLELESEYQKKIHKAANYLKWMRAHQKQNI